MPSHDHIAEHPTYANPYTAEDVLSILRENQWLATDPSPEQRAWADRAAQLLGRYAEDRSGIANLLRFVFHYNAAQILQSSDAHTALSRYAARDVIRHLALLLLDPAPFTSDRFKEIVAELKEKLAGRIREGELDRIILLLDDASALPFAVPVKSARARILEFCSGLD